LDLGSTVPLYILCIVDLSPIIVETLNKWIEPKGSTATVTPTSGTK
jgi:hypothetical protein